MGCICSFFKTLTSYHGSHLTPKQVQRQRQQRVVSGPQQRIRPPDSGSGPDRSPSFTTPRGSGDETRTLLGGPPSMDRASSQRGFKGEEGGGRKSFIQTSFERQSSLNQGQGGPGPGRPRP